MAVSPVLVVKVSDSVVSVRARFYDDFSEHEIILNSVITYWWANNLPPAKKFLELFDSVIKRTINEIMPFIYNNIEKVSNSKINITIEDIETLQYTPAVEVHNIDFEILKSGCTMHVTSGTCSQISS